jgi:hypothetical protein
LEQLERTKKMYDLILKTGNRRSLQEKMNISNVYSQLSGNVPLCKPTSQRIEEVFNQSYAMEQARLNSLIAEAQNELIELEKNYGGLCE